MDAHQVLTTCADFGRLVRLLPDNLLVVTSDGEVLYANLEATHLLARLGTQPTRLPTTLQGGELNGTVTLLDQKYAEVILQIQSRRIVWQDQAAWLWQVRDITVATRQTRELEQQVYRDHLTGIYNRRGLENAIATLNAVIRLFPYTMTVLFIDIDGLKQINDTYGHAEGDAIIRETAQILTQIFHVADIKARIGGDEFVVIAKHKPHRTDCDLMGQLLAEVGRRNSLRARPYAISLSIGAITYVAQAQIELEKILAQADHAMYESKFSQMSSGLASRQSHRTRENIKQRSTLLAI